MSPMQDYERYSAGTPHDYVLLPARESSFYNCLSAFRSVLQLYTSDVSSGGHSSAQIEKDQSTPVKSTHVGSLYSNAT